MSDSKETVNNIVSIFGSGIINDNNTINRKKLADIVFTDPEKLTALNNIIHPALRVDFEQWTQKQSEHYCIMESAILFETDYYKLFDKIICISSPEDIMISRVIKRDNSSETEVLKRLHNQMNEKEKTSRADYVIINDEKKLVIPQVLKIHSSLSSYMND